jgi:hypothetical protein
MSQSPIDVYMGHPSSFAVDGDSRTTIEARIAAYMLEAHPYVHTTFDAAADEALMRASSSDDGEDWVRLLALVYGSEPDDRGEVSADTRPQSTVSVHKLILGDIIIASTDHLTPSAHLEFRAANPGIDALWLPDLQGAPTSSCLRIITSRSLLGRFQLDRSNDVPGRSRPPR